MSYQYLTRRKRNNSRKLRASAQLARSLLSSGKSETFQCPHTPPPLTHFLRSLSAPLSLRRHSIASAALPSKKKCATLRALAACCAHNTTKQPNDLPMCDFHAAECRRQPAICRAEPHIPATTPNAMPSAACFVGNTQLDRRRSKQPGAVFSRLPGELIRGLPQWDCPSKITSEQPRNLAARHLARPYASLRPCWRRTRGAS